MANDHSTDEVILFLQHAGERGMIPAATVQALAVASRNVFGILSANEKKDVRILKMDDVIKRFMNKRAKEFNPTSLKEYGRRTKKAVDLFTAWRKDPSNFNVKTRTTSRTTATGQVSQTGPHTTGNASVHEYSKPDIGIPSGNGYETTVPVRAGHLVTISNIPTDLTKAEAEKLAGLIQMLAVK
ncbi:MAG: hypothetical protein ABI852_13920 [Gemmatimonadaceae bacterium]